jgi:hypothetical protein
MASCQVAVTLGFYAAGKKSKYSGIAGGRAAGVTRNVNSRTHEFPSPSHSGESLLASPGIALVAATLALLVLGAWLCRAWLRTLTFDDAYMFYRYALNLRHGLGMAWNPDGAPTYGMTSLPWVFVVLPLTALPLTTGHALQLASWLVGVLAIAAMAACVVRHARSEWLRFPALSFAAVALPLSLNPVFAFHLTTGMDTMLSLLANAVLVWAILDYRQRPAMNRAGLAGLLAFGAVLARPDNGLCALGSAGLTWLALDGRRRWLDLLALCGLPVALVGTEVLVCKAYFHIPLPLGFYAKSLHSYAGFQNGENAVEYAYIAGSCALPFLGALAATLKRKQLPLVLAFLLPVAATVAYLLTVRQVMGFGGRYYIPFIPYAVIPALLSIDAALAQRSCSLRQIGFGLAIATGLFLALRPIELGWEKQYRAWVLPKPIPVPALPGVPGEPLPPYNWITQPELSRVIAPLAPGAVIAASEVGYLGAMAPRATIIDLVGLNDTYIGTHGFSMNDLLARNPDLIWLPQQHYTGLLATMLSDPRLLERYVVVAHVFNFGLAIRCTSRLRPSIESGLRAAWSTLYPSLRLADYTVSRCEPVRENVTRVP